MTGTVQVPLLGQNMGAIWFKRIEFAATISELAGFKSGLALNQAQILTHVPGFSEWFEGADEARIRIRSEEVAGLFGDLLFSIGSASRPGITFPVIALFHKYKNDPDSLSLYESVMTLFTEWAQDHQEGPFDLVAFAGLAGDRFGPKAGLLALEFIDELQDSFHKTPWNAYRRVQWVDSMELSTLFESERLGSAHGRFFDQRFVDYLHRNFHSIDSIHWRQFEGLTAEFFDRAGFRIEIGPGRNDDSVDIRAWRSDDPLESPPAMLVQCKRQRDKVGKVVVKALWADITHESAKSGLIVTTSALSPGAKRMCVARAYPIDEANREAIQRWVLAMRTPAAGVFMGE